ncbi:MAG: hypothetical protein K9M80_01820 [Candidatus Marinimicrobia bacterium]|nr:hypothetical protein [Candidatus Neomarinimicrobiota bacterium]
MKKVIVTNNTLKVSSGGFFMLFNLNNTFIQIKSDYVVLKSYSDSISITSDEYASDELPTFGEFLNFLKGHKRFYQLIAPDHDFATDGSPYTSPAIEVNSARSGILYIRIINDGNIDVSNVVVKVFDSFDGNVFEEITDLQKTIDDTKTSLTIRSGDFFSNYFKVTISSDTVGAGKITQIEYLIK